MAHQIHLFRNDGNHFAFRCGVRSFCHECDGIAPLLASVAASHGNSANGEGEIQSLLSIASPRRQLPRLGEADIDRPIA